MTTPLRRRIRHARRWTGYGLLVLLILLALLVGVANQLLPMVERHPDRIADWLSVRVGEPVSFSHAHAEWTRRGPRFIFDDLHVGQGATRLAIGRAQLQVAMYSGLLPGQPLTELKIRDLSLTLEQGRDGRWRVIGLPGQDGPIDPLDRLDGFGELQIERAQLAVHAPGLKLDMHLPRIDARLRVNGPRLRVGVSAWVGGRDAAPLSAVLDFQRERRGGLLWVGGKGLRLTQWAPLFAAVGIVPLQGQADLGLWARLSDQRISRVIMQADMMTTRLRAASPRLLASGERKPAELDFERLRINARWLATRNGWRLQAPVLNMTRNGQVARLDNLTLDMGRQFRLLSPQLDLSPLAAVVSLSDRFPDAIRLMLSQTRPQAVLKDVVIHGWRDGPMRGSMTVSQLLLQPFGTHPGLDGLTGKIQFDERGGVMRLDSSPVRLTWPAGLRQPLDIRPRGTLAFWKNGTEWELGSSLLRLQGEGFATTLRMQLAFQGDGSAPSLSLAANVDPASFATAKKFWILHKMPASAVEWLDNALIAGQVIDGRLAVAGDLDDWPFRNQIGAFDARARISDATLKFNKDWPAGKLQGDVTFDGPGFSVIGRGELQGNQIDLLTGGIADFNKSSLDLDVHAQGPAENLRLLMLASPLEKAYGTHLRAASIRGDSAVSVKLHLPLQSDLGERVIEGNLDLSRATLADSRWDLLFTDVSGHTRFSNKGFATESLKVRWGGQPGIFNLKVGEQTGDPRLAAIASLDGHFSAANLIDRYADLAWLKPWMSGSSPWNVSVAIPAGKGDVVSSLVVRSDLVGTGISLPAPLKKAESTPLPLELRAALPLDRGDIHLKLGRLMRLQGQMKKGAPMSGSIQFGEGPLPAAPPAGLAIGGTVDKLDSTGWVGFSGKGQSSATVQSVDVKAGQLIFVDRAFADSRLQLSRDAAATHVSFRGKDIDGVIDVSGDSAHGVQGRFARLYLPSDEPGAVAAVSTPVVAMGDPSQLPPLRFTIADLRIGQAQLGKAELNTSPFPAGLRVDRFRTQTKNLSLDAAGEWVRTSDGTRSNFKLDFRANSLGQMLDALGYADMVQGGKTQATLAGSWPGSPGAFGMATLSGTLKAEIGKGRLLDVEPGGSGRILGLISLAEIPRRLSLDFSDFFEKGFSFNTAQGDFVFNGGTARTENLRIDGPSAEIRVSGNTGLRDKVYDQRVEVLPKAGGLLPAIGLLAGGPAGAAVGAVAQAVLQRPLKQSTRIVYQVTGPWQKPLVKVIEKGPNRSASAAAAPGEP